MSMSRITPEFRTELLRKVADHRSNIAGGPPQQIVVESFLVRIANFMDLKLIRISEMIHAPLIECSYEMVPYEKNGRINLNQQNSVYSLLSEIKDKLRTEFYADMEGLHIKFRFVVKGQGDKLLNRKVTTLQLDPKGLMQIVNVLAADKLLGTRNSLGPVTVPASRRNFTSVLSSTNGISFLDGKQLRDVASIERRLVSMGLRGVSRIYNYLKDPLTGAPSKKVQDVVIHVEYHANPGLLVFDQDAHSRITNRKKVQEKKITPEARDLKRGDVILFKNKKGATTKGVVISSPQTKLLNRKSETFYDVMVRTEERIIRMDVEPFQVIGLVTTVFDLI
jgi:hypothetical protein